MKPANLRLADIERIVEQRKLKKVDTVFIKEPSTEKFHPSGLYSEEIFGQIASPLRLVTFGFIDLIFEILHPHVYKTYGSINRLYEQIISGKTEAVWDEKEHDFFRLIDTKQVKPYHEVGTGYVFFMKHHLKIKFKESETLSKRNDLALIAKFKHILSTNKWLVEPAGLRDYRLEDERPQIEEINKLYTSLIINVNTLPSKMSDDPIWDPIRYSIQKKLEAIREYIYNILNGKGGFIQKKYTAKSIAMGTRNVLTGTLLCSASTKGNRHKSTETRMPLFQAAKAFLPFVTYYMNVIFLSPVIDSSSNDLFAIEPGTNKFLKISIDEEEKKKFTTREGIEDRVEIFRSPEIRDNYFSILANNKKRYYLYLVYDEGDTIHLFRNLDEFSIYFKELTGNDPDPSKIRPLTNVEVLYICTDFAVTRKFTQTTRYPVLGSRNTYLSNVKVMTTEPFRKVVLKNTLTGETNDFAPFYEYPILTESYVDGVRIHSIWLKNIGGDHDGDTDSNNGVWSNEANQQAEDYMNSINYFLTPSGTMKLTIAALNPVIDITFKNMSLRTHQKQIN